MTQDLTLMQAAVSKMHWHEERQKVLSENIANANTPGYKPRDIAPMDFKTMLESSASTIPLSGASLSATNPAHLSAGGASPSGKISAKLQKNAYETTPVGNAVVLEEQLLKMNENYTDHRLTTTIYQKNVDMMKSSIR